VDNVRNPPVPHVCQEREVLLPAYLAPPGALRGNSREQLTPAAKSEPTGRPRDGPGNDSIHHSDHDGSAEAKQRDPQGFGKPGELSPDLRRWPRTTLTADRPISL